MVTVGPLQVITLVRELDRAYHLRSERVGKRGSNSSMDQGQEGVPEAGGTRADWRRRLPGLLEECIRSWGLKLVEPLPAGAGGLVARVQQADGSTAVLKLVLPHRESEHEADALQVWNGDGAIRLLARDDDRSAMLLEHCDPGTPLSGANDADAIGVFIDLLPRLWKPAGGQFHSLAAEAAWWVSYLPDRWRRCGRPFEPRLLEAATEFLTDLSSTQGDEVLLHQDLHGDNVLAAQRQPWLAIDPKPLRGEKEFGPAPIIRSRELGHSLAQVVHRLDRLASELSLDRDRVRCWTIGQTVAWCFEPSIIETHVEAATWLLDS